jgi:hypothetical protein
MRVVLRTLARPWRMLRKLRVMANTFIVTRRQMVQLQLALNAEVRELHQSSLLAAIRLLEEQRQAREAVAEDYTRLEQRLESLERQLAATAGAAKPVPPAGG